MKNWRRIDNNWINMDSLKDFWVKGVFQDETGTDCQFAIFAQPKQLEDRGSFQIFNKQFDTFIDAQKYLDEFMSSQE